ncbi:MAG: enoyl-CoA hydratase [Calditrichaeota bacterium]|nr:MAG: enoyl-CoA hydratase [Calditrichota bacterium]
MSFSHIKLEITDTIAVITINRPKQLNALNHATIKELDEALQSLEANATVRGILLTGSGEKAFVAGADIKELATLSPVEAKELSRYGQQVFGRLSSGKQISIALINGFALGGGLELAMACHLRIAAEHARMGQPEVNLGLVPGYGGTQRLPRLVGEGRALELLLSGEMIDARRAYEIGLVNKVVAADQLHDAGTKMLSTILDKGPLAVAYCVEAVRQGLATTLNNGLEVETSLFGMAFSTRDKQEGTHAFMEKRKPVFQGR